MNILRNLPIGKRLGLGFAVTIALAIVIAAIALWRLNDVAQATHAMMASPLAKERMISDWYSQIDSAVRRTTAIAKSSDTSLAAYFADESKRSSASSAALQKDIEALLAADEEKTLFARIMEQRKVYLGSRDEVAKLKAAGQLDEAARIFETVFVPGAAKYQDMVKELLKLERVRIDETAAEIGSINERSRTIVIALALAALIFGSASAWWLTVGITRPLRQAVDAATRVASGDLTGRIEASGTDETGTLLRALGDMNQALLNIVTEVRSGTENIKVASTEIAAGNHDLSARTEQQAGALEETASSMEELTSTVRTNADNARQANQMAAAAAGAAAKGGDVVQQVVGRMNSIDASSKKIVDIIGTIDGIAFQTNILALNAAVEAARAGEQGRGFAVVAGEVRNLAQRSAAAAREIKELIGASVAEVAEGSRLVTQAGSTMDEITASVRRVSDVIGEITAASVEQSAGIEEVNGAIVQMDAVTQQNAALVEQSAAAAESMQHQASALADVVSVFRTGAAPAPLMAVKAVAVPSKAPARAPVAAKPALAIRKPVAAKPAESDWEEF
ncbi:methyl-accepting chemotaxis protein [Pseudoduganella umbonata]|uniref:HAMP domain-containing protein n=1 Tax=Pseudoduganella umbonata TaxID=864828 RepID=A0A4P8HIL7_9BURK|nr:methyl-accepting chemotaxis protein [Pseudoduganella umbonata]MBB3219408.1 methyl-accepting chemotaxis protein [Pseudoduganella umbonata]QCP09499.1 HAMP domain-containing protein [Pseudoduganella umbonata]